MSGTERSQAGYRYPGCCVCGERLRLTDHTADRRTLGPDGGLEVVRGHRACLKEGIDRWNRLNRPHGSALEASRRDGWTWHTEPPVRLSDS